MKDNLPDNSGVIVPPPLIYAGTLAAGLLLHDAFPVRFLPRVVAPLLGITLVGTAGAIITSAAREMLRADTPLNATEPTNALVVEGPFSFTRNPVYLSFTLLYAGIAAFANALWVMLLLPVALAFINRQVIDREERYLERKFGEQYLRYKARVRRWI